MAVSEQQTAVVVGGTGDGGQVVVTPPGQPNIIIRVITPFVAIFMRAVKTYFQTLLGLMSAYATGAASSTLPVGDFMHTLRVCAGLSVGAAVMSVLMNIPLLLTDLGERFPVLKV